MNILVTGGAGYIGSHTALALLREGYNVIVVDNLINGHAEAIRRVKSLGVKTLTFYHVDLLDRDGLDLVFNAEPIDAVIHFAALKSPAESVAQPLRYYHNNLTGTINLLERMAASNVRHFVFSSSATVYGDPAQMPVTEETPLAPVNPYGRSKVIVEEMLQDLRRADERWSIAILRYFNPIGADPSGLIGEDPNGIPNNLLPYIAQVAVGRLPHLPVYGDAYPTPDGTGVRDYIHVVDLAEGHLEALNKIFSRPGLYTYNLGTGRGYSVREVVSAFERASGRTIPLRFVAPRPGDAAVSYADATAAARELGWVARRGLDEMMVDTWRWQRNNPNGYAGQ